MEFEEQPLINWESLVSIVRRTQPNRKQENGENIWDNASRMYNQMIKMEASFTLNQIDAMPLSINDEVLDCGCGPGRITMPVAKRVKSVTAMDSSELMLNACKDNVKEENLNNVDFVFLDFNTVDVEKDLKKFDVVICSRSNGYSNLVKLSSMSKKIVAIVTWANAPTIPHILSVLFENTHEESNIFPPTDRRISYNILINQVYDLGYEPNVSIVEDGFIKTFASKEDAYKELSQLKEFDSSKMDIFKSNVDNFLTENKDGTFTFLTKTKSAVIWWNVNKINWNNF